MRLEMISVEAAEEAEKQEFRKKDRIAKDRVDH